MASSTGPAALRSILFPASVAVVGASTTPGKLGHTIMSSMIDGGFEGPIYPINTREETVLGRPAFADLTRVPGDIDLAVVAVPHRAVVPVMQQAATAGVKGAVIISAGFAETGGDGAESQRRLREISQDAGIPIIGPNCQGVLSRRGRVSAWFGPVPQRWGTGLLVSQSGGLAGTLIGYLNRMGGRLLDTVVSLGNKCSVDEADLLESAVPDPEIRFALCYIEGFDRGRGRAFVDAAVSFRNHGKVVVVLKGGRSDAGSRAASSHTGSLAGSDRVFTAAMKQAGVIETTSIGGFVNVARLVAVQEPRAGQRVLILTNLGGPGVVAADLCERHGLEVIPTPPSLQQVLRDRVPPYCSIKNPIDLAGDPAPERYGVILKEIYASRVYDGVLIVAAPLAGGERVAQDIVAAHGESGVPTAVCWMGDIGETGAGSILEGGGLPVYVMPEDAIEALAGILNSTSRTQEDRIGDVTKD